MNKRDCENLWTVRGWLFAWHARSRQTDYMRGYREGVMAMEKAAHMLKRGTLSPDDIGRKLTGRLGAKVQQPPNELPTPIPGYGPEPPSAA